MSDWLKVQNPQINQDRQIASSDLGRPQVQIPLVVLLRLQCENMLVERNHIGSLHKKGRQLVVILAQVFRYLLPVFENFESDVIYVLQRFDHLVMKNRTKGTY